MKPFGALEWQIAFRYLRSRRREAFISVISSLSLIGIALGVATLIIVMAVMNGFRAELFNKILGVSGHMLVQPLDGPLSDYREVTERIITVPGVRSAIPFIEGQALISGTAGSSGTLVRGLAPEDFARLTFVSDNIIQGDAGGFGTAKTVIVGSRLARALGIVVGDMVQLINPNGAVTPFGVTPQIDDYLVQGIFEIGMSEYDAAFLYMPLDEAQLYFDKEGIVDAIEVYADDPDAMDRLRPLIQEAAERPIYIVDW